MKNKAYYKEAFASYPDVVSFNQLCKMIRRAKETAYRLLQNNTIQHFYIRTTYYIPKKWVIDYLICEERKAERKKKMKERKKYGLKAARRAPQFSKR